MSNVYHRIFREDWSSSEKHWILLAGLEGPSLEDAGVSLDESDLESLCVRVGV